MCLKRQYPRFSSTDVCACIPQASSQTLKVSPPILCHLKYFPYTCCRLQKIKNVAKHNELGKAGEDAAVAYLEKKGYIIRHRNWRRGHLELDIVAVKDDLLIIVEVKTRSNTDIMQPEEAVNLAKIKRTVRAADTYVQLFQIDAPVRFDVVTAVGEMGNFKIELIEEAFYPPLF